MRWSTNKRLYLEMGLIQAVHSLAEANISDIIRALNGAPLPETPIATVPLPAVSIPGNSTANAPAPTAPAAPPAPAPEPIVQPQPPAPQPAQHVVTMPPGLEPIDDAPPLFGDMPTADAEAPTERPLTPEDWEQILNNVREQSPIAGAGIGHTIFISDDDGLATIAIHPDDMDTRDALLSDTLTELISNAAQERCGHGLRLRIANDASVPPPTAVEILPPPNFEELAPAPKPAPKPAKAPTPAPAAENTAPASLKPTDEEFYNDPLIEQALEVFHATLIKQ